MHENIRNTSMSQLSVLPGNGLLTFLKIIFIKIGVHNATFCTLTNQGCQFT
jgi:hypothetical protein